tara:strand:+ start:103 stop:834 length:732 start_codon:yes stop_codon:yes gene_type:complete
MAYGTLNAGTITPGSGNTLTINEPVTHTGAVTLPSPVINTGVSGSAVLDSDTMSGASATKISSSESIKAYVDANSTADQAFTTARVGAATTAAQGVGTGNTPQFAGVKITATGGINFSAYATSGNPSSNLLDDYEEGTWTLGNVSSGGSTAYYTKIGNLVSIFFDGTITLSSASSAGLPFPVATSAPVLVYHTDLVLGAGYIPNILLSSSSVYWRKLSQAGGVYTDYTDLVGQFRFSATYRVA